MAARQRILSHGLAQGLTEAVTGRFRDCLLDPEPQRQREAIDWARTVSGMTRTVCRGLSRVRSLVNLTMAANNLARLLRLLAA